MDHFALELRRLLLFMAGFAVGGLLVVDSAHAQALPVDWVAKTASAARVTNAASVAVSVGKVGTQTVSAAANGGAMLRAVQPFTIANAGGELALTRAVTGANVLRAGMGVARLMGPVGIGLTALAIGNLLWDAANKEWTMPSPLPMDQYYWSSGVVPGCTTAANHCDLGSIASYIVSTYGPTRYASWEGVDHYVYNSSGAVAGAYLKIHAWYSANGQDAGTFFPYVYREAEKPVADQKRVPADDPSLTAAVQSQINSGQVQPQQIVERALAHDVAVEPEPLQVTGPASVPGPVTTKTATGPAGQTQTQTATNYDLGYNGDKVSVSQTTTTTVTNPDGAVQTQTETLSGDAGEVQQEGPAKDDTPETPSQCEQYPESLACQELGDPEDTDLPEQESAVLWQQEGTAAGSCPSPVTISYFGQTATLSFDMMCDYAKIIRPMVIGLAWLSAGIFLFMIARGTR
ncbi:virulence factor TspB C-terminal domain-related protein [Uliginosibacterium sp. sgz301328]|uniref:virulence factor TspB C-terminal domain-related protein n=1 Tax=Uliginosibacterium sp. sgz301328 TaxID=3243764 RepID=UPI00359D0C0C